MAEFRIAYALTEGNEGGYVCDRNDKGGETYRGISRKWFPDWEGWLIIDDYKKNNYLKRGDYIDNALLDALVLGFYEFMFWERNRLDKINNQDIANEIFDTAVNMGSDVAIEFVQFAINLLNRDQHDYKDIPVDRKIGPVTISLVNSYPYPEVIVKVLNGLQFSRYVSICLKDPTQEANFRGWLKRV